MPCATTCCATSRSRATPSSRVDNLIEKRYNPELCNKLGNLLNRTLKMLAQYAGGIIPDSAAAHRGRRAGDTFPRSRRRMSSGPCWLWTPAARWPPSWKLVEAGNGDIDTTAPWKLNKAGDTQGVADALYAALEATRIVSVLLTPLLPHVAGLIRAQLGLGDAPLADWAHETVWGGLPAGTQNRGSAADLPAH